MHEPLASFDLPRSSSSTDANTAATSARTAALSSGDGGRCCCCRHTCTRAQLRAMGSVRSLRSKFKIRPGVRGWRTRTHLAAENAATESHSEPRQDSDNENDGVDGQDQQEQGAVDWTHEEVGPPGEVGLEATTQPAQNTARQRNITCSLPQQVPLWSTTQQGWCDRGHMSQNHSPTPIHQRPAQSPA